MITSEGQGNPAPMKYGTALTDAQIREIHSAGLPFSVSLVGRVGFALGIISGFQYPLITNDGGSSWAIGGPYLWFSGHADDGASIIKALNGFVAVAYGNRFVYLTTNAGRSWSQVGWPGTALSASVVKGVSASEPNFTADVAWPYQASGHSMDVVRQYRSVDGGRTWTLVSLPPTWPKRSTSVLKSAGSYANPAKLGDSLSASDLKAWPINSESFIGTVGYGLGGVNGFQYPIKSVDDGGSWRIAGMWFAGPFADGASFAMDITALSTTAADARTQSFFYTTVDGGRHWYQTTVLGDPETCSLLRPRRGGLAAVMSCSFASLQDQGSALYLSDDGGQEWHLIAGQPSTATGDPGGRVLTQLLPIVSALSGLTSANYVWKMEPHQDSCDGIPSTRGWSQVVLQMGFTWRQSPGALFTAMNSRLTKIGWVNGQSQHSSPPGYRWTRQLASSKKADLEVNQEYPSSQWQLDALAPPVGKPVSGC
ncbi:MAG: hypothetical protein ACHQFZ_04600 [Acidimicrobiales bacterium]